MNHLELFSGTHSFGKVSSKLGYNVYSLDRDLAGECPFGTGYKSKQHIFADIMTWDYKLYPKDFFKIITASPVCMWWSQLRSSWIGRKIKAHGETIITREILDEDIEIFGTPMVDKVFEIIDYFNPKYFIIENPKNGKMKEYINDLIPYYDVDYCMYGFPYKKSTIFWTNIPDLNFNNCNHKKHIANIGGKTIGNVSNILDKYRIPQKVIEELFGNI
jgi:site-specific DNA-cytosine methylase